MYEVIVKSAAWYFLLSNRSSFFNTVADDPAHLLNRFTFVLFRSGLGAFVIINYCYFAELKTFPGAKTSNWQNKKVSRVRVSTFKPQVTVSMQAGLEEARAGKSRDLEGRRRPDQNKRQGRQTTGRRPRKPAFCQSWISLEQRYQRL